VGSGQLADEGLRRGRLSWGTPLPSFETVCHAARGESGIYGYDVELSATPDSYVLEFAGPDDDPDVLVKPYRVSDRAAP